MDYKIKTDYVSFGVAKLLKTKGFDEYCICYYNSHEDKLEIADKEFKNDKNEERIAANSV